MSYNNLNIDVKFEGDALIALSGWGVLRLVAINFIFLSILLIPRSII